jgi:hypothetical protein
MELATNPFNPCPCGSGKKYKDCCLKNELNKHNPVFKQQEKEWQAAKNTKPGSLDEDLRRARNERHSIEHAIAAIFYGLLAGSAIWFFVVLDSGLGGNAFRPGMEISYGILAFFIVGIITWFGQRL